MFRLPHHPKAFLSLKRNIKPGLLARTQLLSLLEKRISTTSEIYRETELSYTVVLYHLHLLETENIISRKGKHLYIWKLTGVGQQKLLAGK